MRRSLLTSPLPLVVFFAAVGCSSSDDATPALDASASDATGADVAPAEGALPDVAPPSLGRHVFAHYMVAIRTYGGSVDGYKRDIQEAQGAGIEGFALNAGSWRNANYKVDIAAIFQAAKELGTGFTLFFSEDMSGDLTALDIIEMMKTYQGHANYFRFKNRPVLSTFAGERPDPTAALDFWKNKTLGALRAAAIDPFFVPGFYLTNYGAMTEANIEADYVTWWNQTVDGFFYFGAAGVPSALAADNEAAAKVLHAHGAVYMASVTPQYWGGKQTTDGRRYFEFNGGEGIEAQWRSVIETQKADWVELVTWNDFGEGSYFSPVDDVSKYWPYEYVTAPGFFKTHIGETELGRYFIDWYRTGTRPAITKDQLFYFYRTHPKDAVATNDPLGPVTNRSGGVDEALFITTLLTSPAEVRVTTGGGLVTKAVPAGLAHTRVPFALGAQHFELWRGQSRVLQANGEAIISSPTYYDFNYFTGIAKP